MISPANGPIRLFVLGDARIETPVATIEPRAEIVFATALYLIMERHHPVTRGTLANILWPFIEPSAASHRLRQTIYKLKRLGIPVTDVGKVRVSLGGMSVAIDSEELATGGRLEPADLGRVGPIIAGYDPDFSPAYGDWLELARAQAESRLTRLTLGLIARHRTSGDWPLVEAAANKLLEISPHNEEGTLALAEAHAMRGAKIEASRILDEYLKEVGIGATDLRLSATIMRRRINEQALPRVMTGLLETPLLGRGDAMRLLSELLTKAASGRGQACLVWGDAGIGKTRLLAELSRFARLQGIATRNVRCRPSDLGRPLSAFVDLVPLLRSLRGAIGCSPETMAYLDRLTNGKGPDTGSPIGDIDSAFVYARLEGALFDLVDAVSEEAPIMIVVDDAHWTDSVSLDVFIRMIERCKGSQILFVLASRERLVTFLSSESGPCEIQLTPLDATNGEDLILSIVRQQGRNIDKSYLTWCVQVAEGNPFFLEELTKQWMETGARHAAPPSLASVLDQRIARLDSDAIQLLQACSALEDHSTFDRIEAILGYEPHRMLKAIDDLGNSGMILSGQAIASSDYIYSVNPSHDLLAAAALRRLTAPAVAFLHRRVAGVLEASVDLEPSAALLWDCAKHWQLAGDSFHALHLAKSCGIHLMNVGLPSAAAEAFERTLSFCSRPTDRIDVLTLQARAYDHSSAWAAVKLTEGVARPLMMQLGSTYDPHDDLELLALRACWKTDESQDTLKRLLSCLSADAASDDHRVRAGAMALMIQDSLCKHEDMHAVFARIEELSMRSSSTELPRLEAEMVYHTVCGELNIAIDAAERLLKIQRDREDQGDLFRHLCNASVPYRTAGMFESAFRCLREASAIAESHRMPRSLVRALPMLAHLSLEQGNIDAAREVHQEIGCHAMASDDITVTLDIAAISARIALADGNVALARSFVPAHPEDAMSSGQGPRTAYLLALHVAVGMAGNQTIPDTTLRLLEKAHLKSRRSVAQAFSIYVLYFALVRAGEATRGEILLHEYQNHFRREAWPATELFEQIKVQTVSSDQNALTPLTR